MQRLSKQVSLIVITIKEIPPIDAEVKVLFNELDEHNLTHCPPEICHLTQLEEMFDSKSVLLGVYSGSELCGMGGLKFFDGYSEVTRMYLKEAHRGAGLASNLLSALENLAIERGHRYLRLETSDHFKPAVKFYIKHGFEVCKPFGKYVHRPFNRYMEKKIGT